HARGDPLLPVFPQSLGGPALPVPSHLLGVCPRGHRPAWQPARWLARRPAPVALPSLASGRPGPLTLNAQWTASDFLPRWSFSSRCSCCTTPGPNRTPRHPHLRPPRRQTPPPRRLPAFPPRLRPLRPRPHPAL